MSSFSSGGPSILAAATLPRNYNCREELGRKKKAGAATIVQNRHSSFGKHCGRQPISYSSGPESVMTMGRKVLPKSFHTQCRLQKPYQPQSNSFHEELILSNVTPPPPPNLGAEGRQFGNRLHHANVQGHKCDVTKNVKSGCDDQLITTLPSPPEPVSFAVSALVSSFKQGIMYLSCRYLVKAVH